jgi:hypothetical protein
MAKASVYNRIKLKKIILIQFIKKKFVKDN